MDQNPFNPPGKMWWHGARMQEWLESGQTSPVLVEVSPTGYCNASCDWCFFREKWTGERVDRDAMFNAIQDMAELGVKAINWTGGGEPTLHPHFADFVDLAANLGLKQGLFTNAYREIPQQEHFEWIRVSLTDTEWDKIVVPRVPFGMVVNEVRIRVGDFRHLTADRTGMNAQERKNMELAQKAKSLGASYFQIRPALAKHYRDQELLEEPVYLHQLADENFKVFTTPYKYKEAKLGRLYEDCYGYHIVPSIDWRGHVAACLYMAAEEPFIFGNIHDEDLRDIWNKLPAKVPVVENCQHCCKNHELNKIMVDSKSVPNKEFL